MSLGLIMKLLHVLTAMWFVSGIVGRGVTFWQATKTTHVHTAALNDKGVSLYRTLELIIVAIVTLLMVTKPF